MAISVLIVVCLVAALPASDGRPMHEVQRELSQLLRRQSQAKGNAERAAAVCALCRLHDEIVRDPRFATSDVLKQYRGQLWSRLSKVKATLKQQLGREWAVSAAGRDVEALETANGLFVAATASLGDSLAILEQAQGGLGGWAARGGGPVAADWGADLVELIERTINPAFWDVAGGPGTIAYYRPLQCLVVRATSEVHGNVGGLVRDLREAGK